VSAAKNNCCRNRETVWQQVFRMRLRPDAGTHPFSLPSGQRRAVAKDEASIVPPFVPTVQVRRRAGYPRHHNAPAGIAVPKQTAPLGNNRPPKPFVPRFLLDLF